MTKQDEFDKVNRDAALYGSGFMINGKHVPIEDVVIMTKPEMPDCRVCTNLAHCELNEIWKDTKHVRGLKCTNGSEFKQSPPIRLYEIDNTAQ